VQALGKLREVEADSRDAQGRGGDATTENAEGTEKRGADFSIREKLDGIGEKLLNPENTKTLDRHGVSGTKRKRKSKSNPFALLDDLRDDWRAAERLGPRVPLPQRTEDILRRRIRNYDLDEPLADDVPKHIASLETLDTILRSAQEHLDNAKQHGGGYFLKVKTDIMRNALRGLFGDKGGGRLDKAKDQEVERAFLSASEILSEYLNRYYGRALATHRGSVRVNKLYSRELVHRYNAAIIEYDRLAELARKIRQGEREMQEEKGVLETGRDIELAERWRGRREKEGALYIETFRRREQIRRMKQQFRAQMRDTNWSDTKELYMELRTIHATSNQSQEQAKGRLEGMEYADAVAIAKEVQAHHEVIRTDESGRPGETPKYKSWLRWFLGEQRQDLEGLALVLGGGNRGEAYRVFFEEPRAAFDKFLDGMRAVELRKKAKLVELGITDEMLERWSVEPITFAGDPSTKILTVSDLMVAYAYSQDRQTAGLLGNNGVKPARKKGLLEAKDVIRWTNVSPLLQHLTDAQRGLMDYFMEEFQRHSPAANEVSQRLEGFEAFYNDTYFPRMVESNRNRSVSQTDLLKETDVQAQTLNDLGFKKERWAHSIEFLLGNPMDMFNGHMEYFLRYTYLAEPTLHMARVLTLSFPALQDADEPPPPSPSSVIKERLGSEFYNELGRHVKRVAGTSRDDTDWSDSKLVFGRLMRKVAVGIMGFRATTWAVNRVAGSVPIAFELANTDTAAAMRFLGNNVSHVRWSKGFRATQAYLLEHGYFYDRWERDPLRVYANMPVVKKGDGKVVWWLRAQERIRKVGQYSMRLHAAAELTNAVHAFDALVAGGMEREAARDEVARIMRQTQNPSTPFEESGWLIRIKHNPYLTLMLPFMGNPTVLANYGLKAHMELKRALAAGEKGAWAPWQRAMGGLVFGALTVSLMRYLIGRLRAGDDPEKAKRQARYAMQGIFNEMADSLVVPGAGRFVVDPLMNGMVAWHSKTAGAGGDAMVKSFFDQFGDTLLQGMADDGRWAWSKVRKAVAKGDMEAAEQAFLDVLKLTGQMSGLPAGGVTQAYEMARGGVDLANGPEAVKRTGQKRGGGLPSLPKLPELPRLPELPTLE